MNHKSVSLKIPKFSPLDPFNKFILLQSWQATVYSPCEYLPCVNGYKPAFMACGGFEWLGGRRAGRYRPDKGPVESLGLNASSAHWTFLVIAGKGERKLGNLPEQASDRGRQAAAKLLFFIPAKCSAILDSVIKSGGNITQKRPHLKLKVAERRLQGRQRLQRRALPTALGEPGLAILAAAELRRCPKPAPDAGRRAPLEADAAVWAAEQQQPMGLVRPGFFAGPLRIGLGIAGFKGKTARLQRTLVATRLPRPADGAAKIHQGLIVDAAILPRRQVLGQEPQLPLKGGSGAFNGKTTGKNTLDVAVEDGGATAEGETVNGACRRAADAGQRSQLFDRFGHRATAAFNHDFRRPVQVAGADVKTEAGPEAQHLIKRGCRQGRDIRKTADKALKEGQDGVDSRLLQHDFTDPDAISCGRSLPRQVVAAPLAMPTAKLEGPKIPVHCFIAFAAKRRSFFPDHWAERRPLPSFRSLPDKI